MQATDKIQNRLRTLLEQKKPLLGIYFSAGYPFLEATADMLKSLEENAADFVEVGMPYSDPLADGPVIEACHAQALKNGMTIDLMFRQLQEVRNSIEIPVVLMGYFNPVFKYGIEKFCDQCVASGVDAVILPDMPLEIYIDKYAPMFARRKIDVIFLATPETPLERLKLIDRYSNPFIYLVSSSSTTGKTKGITEEQAVKFKQVICQLSTPVMVGFGISSHEDFQKVTATARGAIVGSAFLRAIAEAKQAPELKSAISIFIKKIRGNK